MNLKWTTGHDNMIIVYFQNAENVLDMGVRGNIILYYDAERWTFYHVGLNGIISAEMWKNVKRMIVFVFTYFTLFILQNDRKSQGGSTFYGRSIPKRSIFIVL